MSLTNRLKIRTLYSWMAILRCSPSFQSSSSGGRNASASDGILLTPKLVSTSFSLEWTSKKSTPRGAKFADRATKTCGVVSLSVKSTIFGRLGLTPSSCGSVLPVRRTTFDVNAGSANACSSFASKLPAERRYLGPFVFHIACAVC